MTAISQDSTKAPLHFSASTDVNHNHVKSQKLRLLPNLVIQPILSIYSPYS